MTPSPIIDLELGRGVSGAIPGQVCTSHGVGDEKFHPRFEKSTQIWKKRERFDTKLKSVVSASS
jgi:hypothetical protein